MTYMRVIPRDLFNEANLLKCYGQMWLNLERLGMQDCLSYEGGAFQVAQNQDWGSLTLENVRLVVRDEICGLERPLNARSAYPLYLTTDNDEIQVFNEDGSFTDGMRDFLLGPLEES